MKKLRIKSAVPIYGAAAAWLIMGILTPIYKLPMIAIALALSIAVYEGLSKKFPGEEVEVQSKADSGNAEVNAQIDQGRATLGRLKEANDAIPDQQISACIERMERAGYGIFTALEQDVTKAPQVRRFMNYYLPTAEKLLNSYRQLSALEGGGENISGSLASIANSMGLIASAFEKQLDALYKDQKLDIETDIQVLETVIEAEGHGQGTTLGMR